MSAGPAISVGADYAIGSTNFSTMPMSESNLAAGLAAAAAIDPAAAAEISAAIDAGDLAVADIWNSNSPVGAHDGDTIGVRKGASGDVCGVSLLHEWEHVGNTNPGDEGDSRSTDPCSPCTHGAMNAESANKLAASICTKEYEAGEEAKKEADCRALAEIDQAAAE